MKPNQIHKLKASVSLSLACVMFLLMGIAETKRAEAQVSGATLSGVVTDLSGGNRVRRARAFRIHPIHHLHAESLGL